MKNINSKKLKRIFKKRGISEIIASYKKVPRPLAKTDRIELMQVLAEYFVNKNNGKYPGKTCMCQICDAFCGLFNRDCEVFPQDFFSDSGRNGFLVNSFWAYVKKKKIRKNRLRKDEQKMNPDSDEENQEVEILCKTDDDNMNLIEEMIEDLRKIVPSKTNVKKILQLLKATHEYRIQQLCFPDYEKLFYFDLYFLDPKYVSIKLKIT